MKTCTPTSSVKVIKSTRKSMKTVKIKTCAKNEDENLETTLLILHASGGRAEIDKDVKTKPKCQLRHA